MNKLDKGLAEDLVNQTIRICTLQDKVNELKRRVLVQVDYEPGVYIVVIEDVPWTVMVRKVAGQPRYAEREKNVEVVVKQATQL